MTSSLKKLSLVTILLVSSALAQDAVTVEEIIGVNPYDSSEIRAGVPIEFRIRFSHQSEGTLNTFINGFTIYSNDGAEWDEIFFTANQPFFDHWDLLSALRYNNSYGTGYDTIFTYGAKVFDPGVTSGFDEWVFSFHTQISSASIGKTLCLDSAFIPPSAYWGWVTPPGSTLRIPTWDGPHCFTVVPCCVGFRGNADNGLPDIPMSVTDLDQIINWMFFGGPAPPCMVEADVNASASVDIADVSYIVEYFWLGGPAPQPCP